jgi:hypothetical protein
MNIGLRQVTLANRGDIDDIEPGNEPSRQLFLGRGLHSNEREQLRW